MKPIPRKKWTNRIVDLPTIKTPVPQSWVHHLAMKVKRGLSRDQEAAVMRGTEAFHIKGRGMSAIAYSYVIFSSGRVYEGRGIRQGGHTFGKNSISLGICAAGNFQEQAPSRDMLEAYRDLISYLEHRGHLKADNPHPTGGHRDAGAAGGGTACPGNNLYDKIPELRRQHEKHAHDHAGPHDKSRHHHHKHGIHPHPKARDGHHHRHR